MVRRVGRTTRYVRQLNHFDYTLTGSSMPVRHVTPRKDQSMTLHCPGCGNPLNKRAPKACPDCGAAVPAESDDFVNPLLYSTKEWEDAMDLPAYDTQPAVDPMESLPPRLCPHCGKVVHVPGPPQRTDQPAAGFSASLPHPDEIPQWRPRPTLPGIYICYPGLEGSTEMLSAIYLTVQDIARGAPFCCNLCYGPVQKPTPVNPKVAETAI